MKWHCNMLPLIEGGILTKPLLGVSFQRNPVLTVAKCQFSPSRRPPIYTSRSPTPLHAPPPIFAGRPPPRRYITIARSCQGHRPPISFARADLSTDLLRPCRSPPCHRRYSLTTLLRPRQSLPSASPARATPPISSVPPLEHPRPRRRRPRSK